MKLDLIDKPTHFMFTSLLVIKSIHSSKKKFNLFYTFIIFTYFPLNNVTEIARIAVKSVFSMLSLLLTGD